MKTLVLSVAFFASSALVADSTPFKQFVFVYDGARNETRMSVSALKSRHQFPYLKLNAPSDRLVHNGKTVVNPPTLGSFFSSVVPGFEPNHEWIFDFRGERNRGSFSFKPISLPKIASVRRSRPLTVSWIGDPIGERETVIVRVVSSKRHFAVEETSVEGATSVTVSLEELKKLAVGRATIQIVRRRWLPLDEKNRDEGSVTGYYDSARSAINVLK